MTAMRIAQESAEDNDKQIVDWELQITALNRRLTLLVSLRGPYRALTLYRGLKPANTSK